jgi:hypothetical protein
MRSSRLLYLTPLLLPLWLAGCGEKTTPVAQVEVSPRSFRLGFPELRTVHLTWHPSAPLDGAKGNPTVFVHLRDDKDNVVRTFDHPFPDRWREGTPVSYDLKLYQSSLAPPLVPGHYRLTLGLAGEGKQRWALDGLGDPIARKEYLAAEVDVPPVQGRRAGGAHFAFSKQWLAPESGGDRQVLARRWLGDSAGAIRVAGLRQPGTLWMVVRIPSRDVAGELQIQEGGTNVPTVLVQADCGEFEASLSGPGAHEVQIPVETVPIGGICRLVLRPNFHFVSKGATAARSVSLENSSWEPQPGTTPVPARRGPHGKGKGKGKGAADAGDTGDADADDGGESDNP